MASHASFFFSFLSFEEKQKLLNGEILPDTEDLRGYKKVYDSLSSMTTHHLRSSSKYVQGNEYSREAAGQIGEIAS